MSSQVAPDARSEVGDFDGLFNPPVSAASAAPGRSTAGAAPSVAGVARAAPAVDKGWGRGPVPIDKRKHHHDYFRGVAMGPLSFNATKADTMDAVDAGNLLHRIHCHFGIDKELENRINAFNDALWYQHTINGASQLQPGRGRLYVAEMSFDIEPIKKILGEDMRRFFRAFADEVADCNRRILNSYDEYDPELKEKAVRVAAVAAKRGLSAYAHLAADSSEASLNLSHEERCAVLAAKPYNLPPEDQVAASTQRVLQATSDTRGK